MATVSFAKEDDLVELAGDFGGRSEKLDVTHETVLRGDTRGISASERFWDSWYWFWRSLTRLRCSCVKGCKQASFRERYALAWSIIIIDLASIILYATAAGTTEWSVVHVTPDHDGFEPGRITLGLFGAFNKTDAGNSDTRRDEIYSIDYYNNQLLGWKFIVVFTLVMVGILSNFLAIGFAFINSYQLVTTLWKGPVAVYLTNLFAGFVGFVAVAFYADLHIWDLWDGRSLLEPRFDLLARAFQTTPYIGFSFILLIVGAGLLILSVVLAWRILLIFPNLSGPSSIFHRTVVQSTMEGAGDERTEVRDVSELKAETKSTPAKAKKGTLPKSPSIVSSDAEVFY